MNTNAKNHDDNKRILALLLLYSLNLSIKVSTTMHLHNNVNVKRTHSSNTKCCKRATDLIL